MSLSTKIVRAAAMLTIVSALFAGLAVGGILLYFVPKLPATESLREVRLQVPLRVYTAEGGLLGEFGEKRRQPVVLGEVPPVVIEAVLAAEDERFFAHPGVDWQGLVRAVWHLVRTGEKGPGGSTITMQVARNFFLGREKTYIRKLNEILLAVKIERELSKEEILALYLNKIFLGHRSYGVAAAARTYYGRSLSELTLAQAAMLAGLPKAPSRFNPIADPARAVLRRNYVLRRMRELGFVEGEAYERARAAPVTARLHGLAVQVDAPYVAEMVREAMESRFGSGVYTGGYRVYTTVRGRLQKAARAALRGGLLGYERRHGFRGAVFRWSVDEGELGWSERLKALAPVGGLVPAVVWRAQGETLVVRTRAGRVAVPWASVKWARRYLDENRRGPALSAVEEVFSPGDGVWLRPTEEGYELAQVPELDGALVALDPLDGALRALVGGFDFGRSKFNRATQARRQPGSSFKPFIYSAAIERGYTAASVINDAPVVFDDPGLEAVWRPQNYSGRFFGPTRLREALTHSRNLVSIRLLRAIGIDYARAYVQRFGLDAKQLPRDLSLALGSGTLTPLELAAGYAVFANGGYRVSPYLIERIEQGDETTVWQAEPANACDAPCPRPAPRAISAQNAWLMNSLMRDVIARGTGRRARVLNRRDLAGKTGTTNDQRDAWFSGFSPSVVTTVWVGFDQLKPLGARETGARAALPIWIDFMRHALGTTTERFLEQPQGLLTARIDARTGLPTTADNPHALFETFRTQHAPKNVAESASFSPDTQAVREKIAEGLF